MEREGDDKSDWTSRDALTFGYVKVIVLCCERSNAATTNFKVANRNIKSNK